MCVVVVMAIVDVELLRTCMSVMCLRMRTWMSVSGFVVLRRW